MSHELTGDLTERKEIAEEWVTNNAARCCLCHNHLDEEPNETHPGRHDGVKAFRHCPSCDNPWCRVCSLTFWDKLEAEVIRYPNETQVDLEAFLMREWSGRCLDQELVKMTAKMRNSIIHQGRTQHHTTWFATKEGSSETHLIDMRASLGETQYQAHIDRFTSFQNEALNDANSETLGITGLLTDDLREDMNMFQTTLNRDAMKGEHKDGSWNHKNCPRHRAAGLSWSCSTSELLILQKTKNMIVASDGTRVIEEINQQVLKTSRMVIEHKTAYVPLGCRPGESTASHQRQVGRFYVDSVAPSHSLPVNVPTVRAGQVLRDLNGERRIVDDQSYRRQFATDRSYPERFRLESAPRRTVQNIIEDQFRVASHMQLMPTRKSVVWAASLVDKPPPYVSAPVDSSPFKAEYDINSFGHDVICGPASMEPKMEGRRVIPINGLGNVMVCATELYAVQSSRHQLEMFSVWIIYL